MRGPIEALFGLRNDRELHSLSAQRCAAPLKPASHGEAVDEKGDTLRAAMRGPIEAVGTASPIATSV